jgi:predicted AAA+ superfamily ATPase
MLTDNLSEWNTWWQTNSIEPFLIGSERKIIGQADDILGLKHVKTIVGLRRSGKSTVMFQFVKRLLDNGVEPERILMVNFEDPILSKASLGEIFDAYSIKIDPKKRPYLFLDEVHRCPDWVLHLRKLYDLGKIEQAFITDSSSKYISKEYSSSITGRHLDLIVTPLSFEEFLNWKGLKDMKTKTQVNKARHHLEDFLKWGGLPEVVLAPATTQKRMILNQVLEDIINKDIVDRYDVNYRKIKTLVDFLLSNSASLFSPRRFSKAYGISLDAINTYMGYLEEVFLILPIPRFSYSLRSQDISPKKVYVMDTGFFTVQDTHLSENFGRVYENSVLIELIRQGFKVYYWKDKRECDFIIKKGTSLACAIQVCVFPSMDNMKRETEGLFEAMTSLKISEGWIITADIEKTEKSGGRTVRWIPLWKFLLGGIYNTDTKHKR